MDKHSRNAGARRAIREMQKKLRQMLEELDRSEGRPPRFKCLNCGQDCYEEYMVHDEVWRDGLTLHEKQTTGTRGVMHLLCLEARIRRKLKQADFKRAPINALMNHMLRNERNFVEGWWELEDAEGYRYEGETGGFDSGPAFRFFEHELAAGDEIDKIKNQFRERGPFKLIKVSRYKRVK